MEMSLTEFLTAQRSSRLVAKDPVNPEIFRFIPFFEEVFEKELWPILAMLSGKGGIAHIECKELKPGQMLIRKGEYDMMVYWLLKGKMEVIAEINGVPTIVNKYDETGHCFGELAIVEGCERTADVRACGKKGATIMEIDWSVAEICNELGARVNLLMMKTLNRKLINGYSAANRAYAALQIIKRDSEKLTLEIEKLKRLLGKNSIPFDDDSTSDITDRIEEVAIELDKNTRERLESQ